jgi:integrase
MNAQLATVNNQILAQTSNDSVESITTLARELFDGMDLTVNTVKDYNARIGSFIQFCFDNGGLNSGSLVAYKKCLANDTTKTVATKNKYLAVARVFCKALKVSSHIQYEILDVKTFKQDIKHKRLGVNDLEVSKIITTLKTRNDSELTAIVYLLALQGLRQIEVVRLDIEDVDLSNSRLMVQGKGRTDKEPIHLHPKTVEALAQFLKDSGRKSGALFVGTGNRNRGKRILTRTIQKWMHDLFGEAGITDKVVHGFRHYFTTTLLKELNGNITAVQRFTRHKSLEVLQCYNDELTHEKHLPTFVKAFDHL